MRFLPAILLAGAAFGQTGTAPSDAPVVGMLNYIHATNDLDRTLAFYHDVFGLDAPQPRPLLSPGVPALTNSPGVKLRLSTFHFPNTPFGFELTEFTDVDRKPGQARTTDPGAALIALRVKDIEPVLAAIKRMKVPIITTSGAPVTIVTPNGKIRSMLIRDPDGYVIEVVESAPPEGETTAGIVFSASMGLTVADMESTVKFYHGLLGFNLNGKMEFSNDPPIVDLIGAPHAQFRELTATVPGTNALIAFYEYKGIPRTPFHLRVPDPGAPAIALRVTDLDGLLTRMRAASVEVTSAHGEVAQFSPTVRNIFVEDPNGLNIELFEQKQ
ncbi:MAG: VOC family protein [Bryobacteraceae bacterium]|jgi:catechol 2,3-dioxygenase-like lactoylglutathione lyase family enzyme